jgi:SHS2 domain-containing protein
LYEIFEHTADVGLRARADDVNELFAEAARALFSVIVANLADVRPVETVHLAVAGRQLDELMRDWLAELLYLFDTRRVVFCRFDVSVGPEGLTADARGEPIDPQRHDLDMEVKAVTWHGLKVERDGDRWLAEVIIDV